MCNSPYQSCRSVALVLLTVLLFQSDQMSAQETIEYNRDVRPILAEHCFACHGPDSAAREADLRLDEREGALEFGAIVPHEPKRSELMDRILSDDPDEIMPPPEIKKKMTDAEKEILKKWISAGAEYQPHWAFIVPVRPELPNVQKKDWSHNAIDRFVLSRLESENLAPAAPENPRTLIRRIYLDVTGLPPNPADVDQFVHEFREHGDQALSDWIDRLMESKSWGEHRARYWLDAARYGDTHGMHFDNYREMWPYRDWIIRSFNANQPFDQFTIEQIAGDLLPNPTDEQLVATGFQRCNITTNEGGTIKEENLALYAADRVQTFGWVYLGLTTNCCQCHDHKFDPITMKDYYSMAAFFRNTTQPALDGNVKDGRGPVLMVPSKPDRKRWESLPDEIKVAVENQEKRAEEASPVFDRWLAELSQESLDAVASNEELILHLPLNEGSGAEVKSNYGEPVSFKSSGDLQWTDKGRFGAAPVISNKSTFDLGSVGDFEKEQSFSYGAWVKVARTNTSAGILARMDVGNSFRGWDLWLNGNSFSVHIIDAWPGNAMKVSTPANSVKAGTWQHVFATYDGSSRPDGIKIYIDGVAQKLNVDTNTIKADASIRTKTSTRIGQRSNSAFLSGDSVQDVRIFGRELSPKEVTQVANAGPVQNWLTTAEADRTPEQRDTLFHHFLATEDKPYMELSQKRADLEAEKTAIQARSPITHVQKEREGQMPMAHILMRGEYDNKGDQVDADTPAVLHPMREGAPKNRLGLAEWIVDPANPLTARVTVNRFWQEVFGQGLVVTPEDFGVMGAPPSNPELLDWLAVEFRESGWNVKHVFKLILMSNTYRQSSVTTAELRERDPNNDLLARGPRFRMDAEMVRDYALSVSGLMTGKMYGPSVKPYQPEGLWDIVGLPGGDTRNFVQSKGDNLYRRTVYTFRKRMSPPPNLEAFNTPSREVCVVKRERTNTPLQALVTLNDPQFVEAARHLAQNALNESGQDAGKTISTIARRALARDLKPVELEIVRAELEKFLTYYRSNPADAKRLVSFGDSSPDEKLDVSELAAWTMVCNQVLNLDEVLSK